MASPADRETTFSALLTTNIVLGALCAGIAGGFVYFRFFYEPEVDPQQTERYLAEAKQRLAEHSDVIGAEAIDLAQDALPPITSAIYSQAQEDYPVYLQALEDEGETYLQNVEQILIAKVKAQYGDYLRAHRDVVKEEFPEHASDENVEKILTDIEQTTNKIVERYYLDEFRRESQRTIALWKQVEPLELPGPQEPSLQEQLADYTADWTVLAVSDRIENSAADAPPASNETKQEQP